MIFARFVLFFCLSHALPALAALPLQPWLDTALPGARIRLPPGVYQGPAIISKPLTLDGDGNVTGRADFYNIEEIVDRVVCFTPGTMIATPKGEVPVESLRHGDNVEVIAPASLRTRIAERLGRAAGLYERNEAKAA